MQPLLQTKLEMHSAMRITLDAVLFRGQKESRAEEKGKIQPLFEPVY